MFRRGNGSDLIRLVACSALALLLAVPLARADDVGNYLEQHGLKQLLAVHLEQQLEQAASEQKAELVLRLASLYAELLESVNAPVERANLEERSRRLLEQAPPNSADELRLALLRGSYRAAEKIAENHRMRLASSDDIQTATKTFADMIPQLQSLRQQIRQSVEVADRRLGRASGTEAVMLSEMADRARNLHSQCTFLTAWALYYQSWLNQRSDNARAAEPLFAELLAPDIKAIQPQDVSLDLRALEPVARSILGMAMCKSLTSSSATAISWIELLEHENTFEPLRVQSPAWKIAIFLEHYKYDDVKQILDQHKSATGELPLAWLRLVAVHALEEGGPAVDQNPKSKIQNPKSISPPASESRAAKANELVRIAVTELAAKGELQQVLDLANRYGAESLGKSGFALQYVHGVMKYQEARQAHGNEAPTLDPALLALYEEAAANLTKAIGESDASNYPAAAAGCRRLIAWCSFFQSRFLDARLAFEDAAANLPQGSREAAEALWMAIVALDKIVEGGNGSGASGGGGGSADLHNELATLIDRFLEQFPSDEHAPKLRLRRAIAQKQASPEAVAELLAIPANSEVYDAAQRRAADLIYQLFRNASSDDRYWLANLFLTVAAPLIGPAARETDWRDASATQSFIIRCRQILEVALTDGIDRAVAARGALDALEELGNSGVDLSQFQDEIDCRRVQERLASDDAAAAGQIADQLWSRSQSSIWSRIAARAMFKQGYRMWKSSDSPIQLQRQALEVVVRYGGRVLHEFKDSPDGLDQPGAMGYHTAVAEASMALWEHNGDSERGRAALFLYEKLLAKRPRHSAFLKSTAILSEKLGDQNKALEHWRKLVAGSQVGSETWYEAKFHVIQLLAASDPARARQVMDQHKQLNPDYGPDPWGPRLKGLDLQIPQPTSGPSSTSQEPSPDGDGPS